MMPARIDLDFAPRRRRFPVLGLLFLMLGGFAAYWTYTDYQNTMIESELTEMKLARYARSSSGISGQQAAAVDMKEAESATRHLMTPWSDLLTDLELAASENGKDVALLEIAPDKSKENVRISGEARTLNHVLDYLSRLQKANTMLYPLLENHEIQTSDRERPVRFVILADWRLNQ